MQKNEVEPWQIFVKTLTSRTITIGIQPFATVITVMYKLHEKVGPPPHEVRLIFGGKQLDPGRMLAEYGVQKGSTLHLVLRLSGGDRSLKRSKKRHDTVRLFSRARRSGSTMITTTA